MSDYTFLGMFFTLKWHPDAEGDLAQIKADRPDAAAYLVGFLQQVKADQDLLDVLSVHDFGAHKTAAFHVQKFVEQHGVGKDRNLYRLKLWDLEDDRVYLRVVYALDTPKSRYVILGIVPRSFNYVATHPLTIRICHAYDQLGIPVYR